MPKPRNRPNDNLDHLPDEYWVEEARFWNSLPGIPGRKTPQQQKEIEEKIAHERLVEFLDEQGDWCWIGEHEIAEGVLVVLLRNQFWPAYVEHGAWKNTVWCEPCTLTYYGGYTGTGTDPPSWVEPWPQDGVLRTFSRRESWHRYEREECVVCEREMLYQPESRWDDKTNDFVPLPALCSPKCKEIFRRRPERKERACEWCGELFTPTARNDQKTCSPAHRQALYRARKQEKGGM